MLNISKKINCTGCGACKNICPQNCIDMIFDKEGFLYPKVDKNICVNCGVCENTCPIITPHKIAEFGVNKCYAGYTHNEQIRKNSSSGGIFSEIALLILNEGGVVFGAAFTDNWNVKHRCITEPSELNLLQGSKYVQSEIGDAYKEVLNFLKKGKKVLFSGTPCQVNGLYSFLKCNQENLVTVDFICHGVPSVKVWNEYLKIKKQENYSEIKNISFRNKDNGWNKYNTKITFVNGNEFSKHHSEDDFMRAFLSNLSLRPSCYYCSAKGKNRNSDITLADFWGVDKAMPQINDDKGLSLIFSNTRKSIDIIEAIKSNVFLKEIDSKEVLKYNPSMNFSANIPPCRSYFLKNYTKTKFKNLNKCLKPNFLRRIIRKIKFKLNIITL